MPDLYIAQNGAMQTTSMLTPITTGTSLKTMLQIAAPSTRELSVVEWGVTFFGSSIAAPIQCELIQTDVAATVTAHVAAGVQPYNNPNAPASLVTLGTSATGYTATAEGTTTASRIGDQQGVLPTNNYVKMFPEGREFQVKVSTFLRVRVLAASAVTCTCYVIWGEW